MHSSSSSPFFIGHINIILPRNWGFLNVHFKMHFDQHLLSVHCMKTIPFGVEGYGDKGHVDFRDMFTRLSNYKQVKHIQLIRKNINFRLTLGLKSFKFENQIVTIQVPYSKKKLNTYENLQIHTHAHIYKYESFIYGNIFIFIITTFNISNI